MQAGYSSLDSIRAVKQSGNITGLSKDPIITLYGYSGGAVAGEFSAELQPIYAPELNIAGAAVGGLIPNMTVLLGTSASSFHNFC